VCAPGTAKRDLGRHVTGPLVMALRSLPVQLGTSELFEGEAA
jgi:hypothetical protein